jgi:hypothetical protein
LVALAAARSSLQVGAGMLAWWVLVIGVQVKGVRLVGLVGAGH